MSTYVIGDIQGCYDELMQLLDALDFDDQEDVLWFAGDLVNRGPKSLETLRFIKNLRQAIVVLGNHDFYLLALHAGLVHFKHEDTLDALLKASDADELCHWLSQQKLAHFEKNYLLVHAGIAPQWNLETVLSCAKELESVTQDPLVLKNLYGDLPNQWNDQLHGFDRLRFICNCFTRMRFCDVNGKLELKTKGKIGEQPSGFFPWFDLPLNIEPDIKIIFGHWAALEGKTDKENIVCVDTGCVWGKSLTAFRIEDQKIFSVKSKYNYETHF